MARTWFIAGVLTGGFILLTSIQTPLSLPYAANTRSGNFICPGKTGTIPRDLSFKSVYADGDSTRSIIDADAQEKYRQAVTPMVRFENALVRISNVAYLNPAHKNAAGQCALDWMNDLAQDRALLGNINQGGVAPRHWTLATLASAYMQIRDIPGLDKTKRKNVESWLRSVAWTVQHDYQAASTHGRHHNNLMYWAAWSVTATGIALDDKSLFNWGIRRARMGIDSIGDDGTLPLELKRGTRAILYHQFAAAPLVLMAEAGLKNGIDLYEYHGGKLHSLIKRIVTGMAAPDQFSNRAAAGQLQADDKNPAALAWLELYDSRFPDQRTRAVLPERQSLFSRRMGGDVRALFLQTATGTNSPSLSAP